MQKTTLITGIVDTHCHLDAILSIESKTPTWKLSEKDIPAINDILKTAKEAGVSTIFDVGCDVLESYNKLFTSSVFDNVYAIIGLHPTTCNQSWKEEVLELKKMISQKAASTKLIGIGEIGLDFYHKPYNQQKQEDGFVAQLELAIQHNLPVAIHVREAASETLKILDRYKGLLKGIIHCFQQDRDFAKVAIDMGFVLGIGGPITYPKNDGLREVIKSAGLEKIVLETDAPFLPPQKFRGKLNTPSLLPYSVEKLAEIFLVTKEEVILKTTSNVKRIFKIDI